MFFPVPYWFLRCMGGLWPVFEACVGGPTGSDRLHDFFCHNFLATPCLLLAVQPCME